jgi:hypothetical protein
MTRLAGILFVIALVLPYARAPVCQAGAHEHGETRLLHHDAAALSGPHDGTDCHVLMGCQMGAGLEPGLLGPITLVAVGSTAEPESPGQAPPDIRLTPESPPPRAI